MKPAVLNDPGHGQAGIVPYRNPQKFVKGSKVHDSTFTSLKVNLTERFHIGWLLLIISGFVTCFSQSLYAQVSITGEIKSKEEQPVSYANVVLLSSQDSAFVRGTTTTSEGDFTLEASPDEYVLKVSSVGYKTYYSGVIEVAGEKEKITTAPIILSENVKQLQEVEVKGEQQLIEKHADRTVINVESSITSAGSSVLEVLRKSPGVTINKQSNTITLRGKSGVQVMIDGKITKMSIGAVLQMLEGMQSDNTKKIELITSPPAKYDAEGEAGIIHIVTKKKEDIGTNGNFGVNLGFNRGESFGGNLNLNHRSKGLQFTLNYSISNNRNIHKITHKRILDYEGKNIIVNSNLNRAFNKHVQSLRTGISYEIGDNTEFSLLANGFLGNRKIYDGEISNNHLFVPDSIIHTQTDFTNENNTRRVDGSIGINHQFDKGHSIKFNFDYLFLYLNNPSSYDSKKTNINEPSNNNIIRLNRKADTNFKVSKIDYTNHINNKFSLEAGLKATISDFGNDIATKSGNKGNLQWDSTLTRETILNEDIMAAYASWQWQPYEQWNLKGGLRYEFTETNLKTNMENEINHTYDEFFPNLSVSRKFGPENKLNFTYNKRITRPGFYDMASMSLFFGPKARIGNNLSLVPAISNTIEISYQLKQWWLSLQYSNSQNKITRWQPKVYPKTNELVHRAQNFDYFKTYGFNTNIPIYEITPWWKIQNDISFKYYEYKTKHLEQNVQKNPFNFSININNTFNLSNNYSIELSGRYNHQIILGIYHFRPRKVLNIGFQKTLDNENGTISLSINDILDNRGMNVDSYVPEANLNSYFYYDLAARSINLTYTRKFGNKNLDKIDIKSGASEERQRVQ